ncbi:MAG: hypothetical protein ACOX0J_09875 [Thermoactinomyces vulgaris]|jgi:hypothetical protein
MVSLYDEGWDRTIEILQNAAKSGEAKERLSFMIKLFNQTETFGHITIHAEK